MDFNHKSNKTLQAEISDSGNSDSHYTVINKENSADLGITGFSFYNIPGQYVWVAPTDIKQVRIAVVGGGGGGGGSGKSILGASNGEDGYESRFGIQIAFGGKGGDGGSKLLGKPNNGGSGGVSRGGAGGGGGGGSGTGLMVNNGGSAGSYGNNISLTDGQGTGYPAALIGSSGRLLLPARSCGFGNNINGGGGGGGGYGSYDTKLSDNDTRGGGGGGTAGSGYGAGGGGASGAENPGGGGGSGGYFENIIDLTLGTTIPIIVGRGGKGGKTGANGYKGGDGAPGCVYIEWNL